MPNVPWGEFFLGSPPGVPLAELTLFPGQPVPQQGVLVPSGEPGFGLNITLEDLERMKV
jgi:L-rhamnonate dehydratase